MPGNHLPWRRSRHWVAPAPSAWLLRAGVPRQTASASGRTRIECELRSPRLACMRDWRALGHAVLPFGCCVAIAAAGAAMLLDSAVTRTPARAAFATCVMPKQALLLPRQSVVLIEVAGSGALQLRMPSFAAEVDSTVFFCKTARLRRCTPPTTSGQRHVRSAADLVRILAASSSQAAETALLVTHITNGQHQGRGTWAAALLAAAVTMYGLTYYHTACTQMSAAACIVAEQTERNGICAATAALCGSTSVITAAASDDSLAVCADATLKPVAEAALTSNPVWLAPCATDDAGLRYTVQWQATNTTAENGRISTAAPEDTVTVSLTAGMRSLDIAEPLAVTARMLAVLQRTSARGAICQAALAAEPMWSAGEPISTPHSAGPSAQGGLMRAAAAEDHDSVHISASGDSHACATLALRSRQRRDRQGTSAHHPLSYAAQRASVGFCPQLLPVEPGAADMPQQLTVTPSVAALAHARPAGTTLIVGGLGGVGLWLSEFWLARGSSRLLLASRTGRSSFAGLQSVCTSAAMVTMASCDVAAQDDVQWLAAHASDEPIDVSVCPLSRRVTGRCTEPYICGSPAQQVIADMLCAACEALSRLVHSNATLVDMLTGCLAAAGCRACCGRAARRDAAAADSQQPACRVCTQDRRGAPSPAKHGSAADDQPGDGLYLTSDRRPCGLKS